MFARDKWLLQTLSAFWLQAAARLDFSEGCESEPCKNTRDEQFRLVFFRGYFRNEARCQTSRSPWWDLVPGRTC